MPPKSKRLAAKSKRCDSAAAVPATGVELSLMQQLEHDAGASCTAGTNAKRVRSFDAKICKIIKDSFPGWASSQIDVMQCEGLTLRQRITKDKAESAKPGSTLKMGKLYYCGLRDLYDDGVGPVVDLVVTRAADEEDPELRKSLIALLKSSGQCSLLVEWMQTVRMVNQKNVCALYRQRLKTYPGQNMGVAGLLLESMKMAVRLDFPTKFKKEIGTMVSHWDLALQKSLANFVQQGLSSDLWWQDAKGYAGLVVPGLLVQKVFDCKSNWEEVADDMRIIVAGSGIGKQLFQRAVRAHQLDALDLAAKVAVSKLTGHEVTIARVNQVRNDFMAALPDGAHEGFSGYRKDIVVLYRGVKTKVQVCSPIDLFATHLEALLRTEGVNQQLLPKLWCEDDLVSQKRAQCGAIDVSLLCSSLVARHACERFVTEVDGATLQAELARRATFLAQADKYFKVELAFWMQSIGDTSTDRLYDAILDCFPKIAPQSLQTTKEALKRLDGGQLVKLCGTGLQGCLTSCLEVVECIIVGSSPNWKKVGQGAFAKKLQKACGRLCHTTRAAMNGAPQENIFGEDAIQEDLFGEDAIKALLHVVVDKSHNKKNVITYSDLAPFRRFAWLLDPAGSEQVKKLMEAAINTEGAQHSKAASSSIRQPEAKKRKTVVKDDAFAMVGKLFS